MTNPKTAIIVLLLYVILVALLFTDCPPADEPAVKAEAKPKPETDSGETQRERNKRMSGIRS